MYDILRWVEGETEDHPGAWRRFARRQTRRGTIRQIRKLQAMGYDRHVSIYVERIKVTP